MKSNQQQTLQPQHQPTSTDLNRSQAVLNYEQVKRLLAVVEDEFEINGRGNFPTIKLCLRQLIKSVVKGMNEKNLHIKTVKMNGGAASHILSACKLPYSDIDLIFDVDFSSSTAAMTSTSSSSDNSAATTSSIHFDMTKEIVMDSLIEYFPPDVNRDKLTTSSMKDAYVRKMILVNDPAPCSGDSWSLITLNNTRGRYVELKFVDRMRRQFEFSVDSFQIHLDFLLTHKDNVSSLMYVTPKFYPTITAESVYGDFRLALRHLNEMLIDTMQPELIRGGGLLKYVQLLVRGYRPARSPKEFRRMERYMCSRFFIDFNTVDTQERKLRQHLDNHLQRDSLQIKYDFLSLLHQIVDESTVCLMNHERRQSLSLIERLAYELEMEMYYQDHMMLMNVGHFHHQQQQQQQQQQQYHYNQSQLRQQQQQQQIPENAGNSGTKVVNVVDENQQQQQHQPKQTILFVPHNASYWIPVL